MNKEKKELFKGEELKALTAPFFRLIIFYSSSEERTYIPGQKVIEAAQRLSDTKKIDNFQFIEFQLGKDELLEKYLEDANKVWIAVPEDHEGRIERRVKEFNPKAEIQFL